VFFAWLFLAGNWTPAERGRLWVLFAFFVAAALFWSVYEQAGSTLTLFADRSTRNSVFGHEFESSYYQSINPILIMTLAPVLAWLWVRLGPRDPSSPMKFSIALIGVGAGVALLIPAARIAAGGTLVGPGWLATTYLIHTVAELCLSPVGLSSMTKLSPSKMVSLMLGVWFLSISLGNYIAGRIAGEFVEQADVLAAIFGKVAMIMIGAAVVLFAISPLVKKLYTKPEDVVPTEPA
jgi:POT family proton-dependent oligopeptide transporter